MKAFDPIVLTDLEFITNREQKRREQKGRSGPREENVSRLKDYTAHSIYYNKNICRIHLNVRRKHDRWKRVAFHECAVANRSQRVGELDHCKSSATAKSA